MSDQAKKRAKGERNKLSLHPLSVEDALRGAMQTGRAPDQPKRRQERKATKRRLKADVPGEADRES